MPEWNDPKYENLLTSNIWKNRFKTIKQKLNLEIWNDPKYQHLLVPSIFSISISNIENGINLLKKYNADQYITNKCLRMKTDLLRSLIEYLVDNNIDLVIETETRYKLNPILSAEKGQLKTKYNIDINNLRVKGKQR